MKLVYILFEDHSSGDGWVSLEDIIEQEPLKCEAVGWVVKETKKMIVLAAWKSIATEDVQDVVNCRIFILKSAIVKQRIIGTL